MQAVHENSSEKIGLIAGVRYLFVIYSKGVKRLLWRMARNVIAGHSWCKG